MYEIFRLLLEENHITTYQVAKATGISSAAFSGWKQGKWNFKPDKLQRIADYFGVSLNYLLTGQENTDSKETSEKPKEQNEIKSIIYNSEKLLRQEGLTFDGKPAPTEVVEQILTAIEIGMALAKKKMVKSS